MSLVLSDEVVIISGGAGLLGKVFSRCIAMHGGTAIVADIDIRKAESVANEIAKADLPGSVDFISLNICNIESIGEAIRTVEQKYSKISSFVNNAYPRNENFGRLVNDVTYEDFCENVSIHLGGYFLSTQQFAKYFYKSGGGNIINMSSIYGIVAPRFDIYEGTRMTVPVEYAAIKAGVIHLTKYFAQFYKMKRVRVNCLSPGGVFDFQPVEFLKRYNFYGSTKGMLAASDLEGALVFLLSNGSACVNGQNIVIDDGWTL